MDSALRRALATLMAVVAVATLAACSDGGSNNAGASDAVETFCARSAADESIFSAAGPTATDSSQALAAFEDLTKIAPAEIKADMTTILNFLKSSSSDASDASVAASVTAASQRVVQFFKDKCHVDLAGSSAESFSTVGSSISN